MTFLFTDHIIFTRVHVWKEWKLKMTEHIWKFMRLRNIVIKDSYRKWMDEFICRNTRDTFAKRLMQTFFTMMPHLPLIFLYILNISRVFLFLSHTWCVDILWNFFDDEYAILTIFICVILIMIKVMKIWVVVDSFFFDDLMGKYSWQLILFDWLI